jgi:3-dehydroquinate dehydratase/shikimate dehydrogenase
MANVALVATLTAPLSSDLREINDLYNKELFNKDLFNKNQPEKDLPGPVAWLQWRADLAGNVSSSRLRSHFPGKLLYTIQSPRHGGAFAGSTNERHAHILAAATHYDMVELEGETDLTPELLNAIPPHKRMISWSGWSGPAYSAVELRRKFDELSTVPAHTYCLTVAAERTSDGLQTLLFLKELKRNDVTAFCTGPFGLWSRLLSPFFGAPFLFGRHGGDQAGVQTSAAGEPSIHRLIADYGFPALRPVRELYGMVGNRVFQSPSPRLHNAGYRAINHPALFVPFHTECFEDFWKETALSPTLAALGLPIQGLTIVSPHKESALAAAELHGPMVSQARASNVFVRRNGIWEAHTTDPQSVACVYEKQNGNVANPRKAAVIGCGGAGRAIAAALQQAGVDVTLVNRNKERGARAMQLLGLPFIPLSEFRAEGFSLLVNATPIGREDDTLPFPIHSLNRNAVVVDLAYGAHSTPLASSVLARGGTVIDGYDVVLTQVRKQFAMMVGAEMPRSIGREDVILGGPAGPYHSRHSPDVEQEEVVEIHDSSSRTRAKLLA